eukprot:3939155-Rhodomonas_salina.4
MRCEQECELCALSKESLEDLLVGSLLPYTLLMRCTLPICSPSHSLCDAPSPILPSYALPMQCPVLT